MKSIRPLLLVALVAGCVAAQVASQEALGITIAPNVEAVSSELLGGFQRQGTRTVDSSGFTGTTHTNNPTGTQWTTTGNGTLPDHATPDFDPFITFDLGGLYTVNAMNIWNYNEASQGLMVLGPQSVEVFAGATLGTMTSRGVVNFAQADGSATYAGEVIPVNYEGIRYLQFDILTNHDGAIFDGTGLNGGSDGRSITGLAEVRFEASEFVAAAAVPEPSALGLLGLGIVSLAGKARARRRRSA